MSLPSQLVVHPIEDRWYEACCTLLVSAFEGDDEARLVEELRNGEGAQLEMVGLIEGRVIGHVMLSEGCVNKSEPVWCLGPMAVDEAWRGRGVGSVLVHAACASAEREHAWPIFLLGHEGFYRRCGFVGAVGLGFTSKFMTPEVPPECFMVRGCDRLEPGGGVMEYPAAFDLFV